MQPISAARTSDAIVRVHEGGAAEAYKLPPRAWSSGSEAETERFEYESLPTQRCVFAHVATHRRATLPV